MCIRDRDTVVIAQFIRRERIAACRAQRQHIPFAAFKERFVQLHERKRGPECLLLTEIAALHVHILRNEQLFHLRTLPVQIIRIVCGHGDEQVQIVEIFMVCLLYTSERQKIEMRITAIQKEMVLRHLIQDRRYLHG